MNTGWIPYDIRPSVGQKLTDEFHERIQSFEEVGTIGVEVPERQIFAEYELKFNGKLLPRLRQITGSCVGAAAETAYGKARLADIVFREDSEPLKMGFPWVAYGIGRDKGGFAGPGEGSFGAAQAWACDPNNFGYIPWDYPGVPAPTKQGAWWEWTGRQERQWSHPSSWPIPKRSIRPDASNYGIQTVTKCTSIDQVNQGLAQGFPMTIASMFGTNARVEGDVLIGRRNARWAHQMSIPPTFWDHPDHGWIYQVDNQWGPRAHASCPTLSEFGIDGSFWILEKDLEWIIRTGEVYFHSNTGNFEGNGPVKDWTMGFTFIPEDGEGLVR